MMITQTQASIIDAILILYKSLSPEDREKIKPVLFSTHGKEIDEATEDKRGIPVSLIKPFSKQFEYLSSAIEQECIMVSSPSQIAMHPYYQKIISFGKKAIPLLIKKLDNTPTYWFWALEEISGTNPVPVIHRGNIPEMIKLWKNWAKENGYEQR